MKKQNGLYIALWITVGLFITAIVLLIVLSFAPRDAVTINQLLLDKNLGSELNTMKIVKFHPSYVSIEFNGKQYNLRDGYDDVTHYCDHDAFGFGSISCYSFSIFDLYFDDRGEYYKNTDYYVFFDGWASIDGNGFVLIPVSEMPKIVDPMTWNATEATIVVWEHPRQTYIVENVITGEVALLDFVKYIDKFGNEYVMWSGSSYVGGTIEIQSTPQKDGSVENTLILKQ